jgi:hypothetical protein
VIFKAVFLEPRAFGRLQGKPGTSRFLFHPASGCRMIDTAQSMEGLPGTAESAELIFSKIDRLALSGLGTFTIMFLFHFSFLPGIVIATLLFITLIISLGCIEKVEITDILRIKGG